jgi:hypothetical protein
MAMPVTPVNKKCSFSAWENEIRRPRQILSVKPEPQTKPMSQPPYCHFGLRVRAFYTSHH